MAVLGAVAVVVGAVAAGIDVAVTVVDVATGAVDVPTTIGLTAPTAACAPMDTPDDDDGTSAGTASPRPSDKMAADFVDGTTDGNMGVERTTGAATGDERSTRTTGGCGPT